MASWCHQLQGSNIELCFMCVTNANNGLLAQGD